MNLKPPHSKATLSLVLSKPPGVYMSLLGLPKQNTTGRVSLTRHFISHSSGGWESKVQVSAGLVSPEASLLGLLMGTFLLCPLMVFPLCVHIHSISVCNFLFM